MSVVCPLICVEGELLAWAADRLAALGWVITGTARNFWAGEFQASKKTPTPGLWLEEIFATPAIRSLNGHSCAKSQHSSRMRLTLRGNKEADGATKDALRRVIECLDFVPPTELPAQFWSVRFVDAQPLKQPPNAGFPIYTAEFDAFWCQ